MTGRPWTTPDDLRRNLRREWDRGALLREEAIDAGSMFPYRFRMTRPTIEELSLMPVTSQWLPVEDSFEEQLVEMLVRAGRSFVKGLRYNMPPGQLLASAILTDAGESPCALFIAPRVDDDESALAVKD